MAAGSPEGWAAQVAEAKFGDDTHPAITLPTVTTAAAKLATNNPDRVQLVIQNIGTDVIAIDLSRVVTMASGLRIGPGQYCIMSADEDGEATGYEWWAISNSGTQQIYMLETVVG